MRGKRICDMVSLLGFVILLAAGAPARGEGPPPATGIVSGWVPNNGVVCDTKTEVHCVPQDEKYLGDMWSFVCPEGFRGFVSVDTKDDTDSGQSCVDPIAQVFDAKGNLMVTTDDDDGCTYPPLCGAACPWRFFSCGEGKLHYVVVRDFGSHSETGVHCQKGGGYILRVDVDDTHGRRLSPAQVRLGGGVLRRIPVWLRFEFPQRGPMLDDEGVPSHPAPKP